MAYAFGIEKPTKATITRSNASEIQLEQYEEIETKEPTIGAIEGLKFQKGDICQFREKKVKITSCDPAVGYITTNTIWEDIEQDHDDEEEEGEPTVEQLECKMQARSSSGFNKLVGMDAVIREVEQKILLPTGIWIWLKSSCISRSRVLSSTAQTALGRRLWYVLLLKKQMLI